MCMYYCAIFEHLFQRIIVFETRSLFNDHEYGLGSRHTIQKHHDDQCELRSLHNHGDLHDDQLGEHDELPKK